ncbi:uncharacterized protein FIESC28_05218 [Fusarium coffeatum]|uniref:Calcineurin-like phosphoesterase domain-containing protein n=1 Tax=Fusarium coffeatum TaxID=231269 RepID=A0A366RUF0_9HYPO|nr:uncharacterized protein FIESC28_05218 [Fusarium coffeatum]RBR20701.1 hypothetical protein FIESC28_05218 [Fusarium coffeatum]
MDTLHRVSEYLFGPTIPHREPCGRKVQIMSDLHLELNRQYATFDFPVKAPFLILGGDIGRMVDYDMFLPFLARQTARFEKVFLVLGNHEFYEMTYEEGITKARELEKEEALEGKLVLLDRNRWDDLDSELTIVGATLWSKIPPSAAEMVTLRVSDYKKISGWTVAKHNECHARDLAYLSETLTALNDTESQRTVLVVTHHAPCIAGSSKPEHANAPFKSAFSTDVIQAREFVTGVAVWMFGHTHFTTEFKKGGVRVVANQRGTTAKAPVSSLTAYLAGLSLQTRNASILGSLANNPGAIHQKKRVGRGPSSGHGKTSGRGHKGQGQHGKVKPWFQGGQTPLIVKHGRKGFSNFRAPQMSEVNIDQIQAWIDQGRLDPTKQITPKELIECGIIGTLKDGVKILSRGADTLKQPIDVMVSRISASAIAAIEDAGGKVLTRYYTKLAIKRLLTGESVNTDKPLPQGAEHVDTVLATARAAPFRYRLPDPTSREDIEYYRDPAHRGYLSHQLAPGESPSLYFKVPGVHKIKSAVKKEKAATEETLF